MKYQAVVFDFDYTLGDATEGIVESVNYALKNMGYLPADRESIRKTIGLSLKNTYRELTKDMSEEKGELFAAYFREKADLVMVAHTELFPDTLELLRYLKSQGLRTGIVTTKYHYRIDAILDKCQAADAVDMIVGGEDVKAPKPDPEGLLLVLAAWDLSPKQILYVGDSTVDARTAEAAGVDFAGVTTGTTTREELEVYPCVGVYEGLEVLKGIV